MEGSGAPIGADFEPVAPCIIWMDRRAEKEVEWIKNNIDLDKMFDITGTMLIVIMVMSKCFGIRITNQIYGKKLNILCRLIIM